jgi:hypothetical protein
MQSTEPPRATAVRASGSLPTRCALQAAVGDLVVRRCYADPVTKAMKLALVLFGISAATVALRSILIGQVVAAQASRFVISTWSDYSEHMFPELLALTLVTSASGVIAACSHIWRALSPWWMRAGQSLGVLLLAR